jgi:WD40 repeat protein
VDLTGTIAFSPDSAWLALSGDDNVVRLWDVASSKEIRQYKGHKDYITSILFTPDGKSLITSAADATIRFWDVASGRETRRLDDVGGYTDCLALSPDGKTLAAAGGAVTIRFWDVETGKERIPFVAHNGCISDVAFAPDGRRVASGGYDGIIRFWDAADGKLLGRLTRNAPHGIDALSWSPDGARLASAADDQTIRLWDVGAGKELHRLSLDAPWRCFAFFPDGASLAVAPLGPDYDFAGVWTPGSDREPRRLDGPTGPRSGGAHSVDVSPDGKWVAVVHNDVSLCEAASGKEVRRFTQLDHQEIGKVRFAPDGRTLFMIAAVPSHSYDLVYVWPVSSRQASRRFSLNGTDQSICAAEFSLDRRVLATGGQQGLVFLWDVASGRSFRSFKGHAGYIASLSFAPGGDLLASGSGDTTGLIWDVTGRRKGGRLEAADLSPDDLERLWKALADESVKGGWDAVWSLAASPKQSVPFLKARLLPRPKADPERLDALMLDLDADNFDTRNKGAEEMRKLGEAAEPYLRKRLTEGTLTAEVEKRLGDLLHELEGSPERRRLDRVYAALERTTDAGAEALLARLADGSAEAWATREAKESLQRLKKRIAGR